MSDMNDMHGHGNYPSEQSFAVRDRVQAQRDGVAKFREAQAQRDNVAMTPRRVIPDLEPPSAPGAEITQSDTSKSFHFFETLLNAAEESHASSKKFYDRLIEVGLLHAKKQKDYGKADDPFANVRSTTEFGVSAWVGALIRMNDKVKRLQSLARHGELHNESAEDSMLDIAVYALIALVLYGEEGAA